MNITGKSAAPGVVLGSIYIYNKKFIIPKESFLNRDERQSHLDRYLLIKEQAKTELEELKISLQKIDPAKAEIFGAHQEIVDDITINEEIPARILSDLWSGDWAIFQVYETIITVLKQTADSLISERSDDFDDVRALLLRLWYGQKNERLSSLKDPVIIAAYDLKPSDTASFDKNKVLAILTETGGVTSHSAIIAKSYGIPAILGIEGLLSLVKQGQQAAVNATEGTVILDPKDDIVTEYNIKNKDFLRDREEAFTYMDKEGLTSCGVKIDIGINLSDCDSENDLKNYVDMAGLFRTEFLFLGRNTLPSEEEQFISYKKVLENYGQKPFVLRTLDIGADKLLSCMDNKSDESPFSTNRGIRFCFNNPGIFKTQIRAALRASVYGNLWLMLPMISSLDCIRKAKKLISDVCLELEKEGIPVALFKTGIMIEVPSIALISAFAAKEVDFASIGSNDLCQYVCAADRADSADAGYYQSYHPAMFHLIKEVTGSFLQEGKPISICGELGSDPLVVPVLIGLGLRKLSMGGASIAPVKRTIASLTIEKAQQIAQEVLQLQTAAQIEEYQKNR
ncbi:MAG: phosphoenolpyruvate--protein phosphotransferase [Treponema sp.]|jgi:phosphotransferase system enzyme I (PtsI)|nr:phosphoenolpyruvate--protein phosphotransferase [Treponema sp.]